MPDITASPVDRSTGVDPTLDFRYVSG